MKRKILKEDLLETLFETPGSIRYASFAKRLKAFGFDYLIICGYIFFLVAVTVAVVKAAGFIDLTLRWPENPLVADLVAFVTLVLPLMLYFTLWESSPKRATWGKNKMRIQVVNANGGTLTRKQAFFRSLVKLIPWQIAHTCLYHIPGWPTAVTVVPPKVLAGFWLLYVLAGMYIVSALVSKKHRTPYDWVSGSYVIEVI